MQIILVQASALGSRVTERRENEQLAIAKEKTLQALLEDSGQKKEGSNLVDPASSICLSWRLSHACLSISYIRRNCEWLIKTVIVSLIMFLHG